MYYKQCKLCPYFDKKKSYGHLENEKLVNEQNKVFCQIADRYIEQEDKCFGIKNNHETYQLTCDNCGKILAEFSVEEGKKGSKVGLMNFIYTEHLFAYRKRADGLIGLECSCGDTDTRLSETDVERYPDKFPKEIKTSNFEGGKFNEKSDLSALLVKKGEK